MANSLPIDGNFFGLYNAIEIFTNLWPVFRLRGLLAPLPGHCGRVNQHSHVTEPVSTTNSLPIVYLYSWDVFPY